MWERKGQRKQTSLAQQFFQIPDPQLAHFHLALAGLGVGWEGV
jgi:hypothetical protein